MLLRPENTPPESPCQTHNWQLLQPHHLSWERHVSQLRFVPHYVHCWIGGGSD